MLVHMQPREVAGLQALAMQGGGSLTINPETGLPEAGWFGDILGAVAPIALGAFLGPAGIGLASSSLGAGMMTGAIGFLASGGNLGTALSAGLGGAGGFGLGNSLGKVGQTALVDTVANPETVGKSILDGGAGSFTSGADSLSSLAGNADNLVGKVAGSGLDIAGNAANNIPGMGIRDLGNSALDLSGSVAKVGTPAYTWGDIGKGAMEVAKNPVAAWKAGQVGMMDALTVASPLMAIQPKMPKAKVNIRHKIVTLECQHKKKWLSYLLKVHQSITILVAPTHTQGSIKLRVMQLVEWLLAVRLIYLVLLMVQQHKIQ
jgi:hypothetical protein